MHRKKDKQLSSYKVVFKEVDVRVSPVIKGSVNRADDSREALRDEPGIAMAFRVLSEHLVLLTVIPPKLSSCIQHQRRQKKTLQFITNNSHIYRITFKEINNVFFPRPHVHMGIHTLPGESMPASLQCDWIAVACSVISVLIQPVPAVSHKIGVKADDYLPIGCLLFSDPVKHCAKSSFTASCEQTLLCEKFNLNGPPFLHKQLLDPIYLVFCDCGKCVKE